MPDHIALRFDWDEIQHQTIDAVLGLSGAPMHDAAARWNAVAICTQRGTVTLTVEPDTDQIVVSLQEMPSGEQWLPIPSFEFALSKPMGWCWIGINSQGYKDSFMLAFGDEPLDALRPRCMFLAEASALQCFDLQQTRA